MSAPGSPVYVLDAYALIAFFKDEPGGAAVESLFRRSGHGEFTLCVAAVNLGELYSRTVREFGRSRADLVLSLFDDYPVRVMDVDRRLALEAAALKGMHRISYADCIAAALALQSGATLVTGDQGFGSIAGLAVEWLPQTEPPQAELE